MPDQRKKIYFDYGINVPTVLAFLVAVGSLVGWLLVQRDQITINTAEIKAVKTMQEVADKGITEHQSAIEQVSIRDRAEMREDIKEILRNQKASMGRR
jgi:hypothetical protein